MAQVAKWKKAYVDELTSVIKDNEVIGIVRVNGIPGPQIQKMRSNLKGKAHLIVAKNNLIERALKEMSAVDDYKIDKEIVAVIEAIEEKTKNIEKTLAVQIDTSALAESADSYYRICQLEVEQQITDFENSTLTVEQEGLLQTAKQHYKEGDCNQALEVIFILSNPEE